MLGEVEVELELERWRVKLCARPPALFSLGIPLRHSPLQPFPNRVGRGMGGSTWQTVKGSQKARKTRGPLARGETMRQQLAKELVVSLFSKNPFSVLSSDDEEPEWKCKECGMFNYATRKKCRRCGEGHGAAEIQGGKGSPASSTQSGKGPSPYKPRGDPQKGGGATKGNGKGKGKNNPPKEQTTEATESEPNSGKRKDPWKTKEERKEMLEKYMRMLEFTKNEGFDEEAVAEVQAKIDKIQKEMNKEPPPGHVLESTIQFLERAKKRQAKANEALTKAQEEVVKCQEAVQQYEDEVAEAETRLEQVKAELAGNAGEINPQEDKLNALEQLLQTALKQTATEAKTTTEPTGETPKAMDEDTQPMINGGGNKRQKNDSITIDKETFMALAQAVQELKSPTGSSKRELSEDDEMIEDQSE